MTDRRNKIHVPERGDNEPSASPAQLQAIRELVTGMSLRGFRFDYRKLGAHQADAVIAQLERLRASSGMSSPSTRRGLGCVGSAVRGVVTLVVVLAVLAGAGAGGFLIYQRTQAEPGDADAGADAADASADASATARGPSGESAMFPGLRVGEPDRPERIEPEPIDPRAVAEDPGPDAPEPTPAGPAVDRVAAEQLEALEALLVQLSQFSRSEYAPSVRAQSSAGMLARIDGWPAAMDAIRARDPALAERIRAVVSGYGETAIDGPAMREEVRAIRDRLGELRGGQ